MVKIIAPNKKYNGVSAGVSFINGEVLADDKIVDIKWFERKGYIIEEIPNGIEKSKITDEKEELLKKCSELDIKVNKNLGRDKIIKLIEEKEKTTIQDDKGDEDIDKVILDGKSIDELIEISKGLGIEVDTNVEITKDILIKLIDTKKGE